MEQKLAFNFGGAALTLSAKGPSTADNVFKLWYSTTMVQPRSARVVLKEIVKRSLVFGRFAIQNGSTREQHNVCINIAEAQPIEATIYLWQNYYD